MAREDSAPVNRDNAVPVQSRPLRFAGLLDMVDKPQSNEPAPPQRPAATKPAPPTALPRRGPGHRGADMRDTVAEMAERAQLISQEAGSKVAAAMKDVISAAAGIAGFAIESARDLVQYMVKRGQMTPEEADKLIREAEAAHDKRPARKRHADRHQDRRRKGRGRQGRSRRERRRARRVMPPYPAPAASDAAAARTANPVVAKPASESPPLPRREKRQAGRESRARRRSAPAKTAKP